MKQLIQKYYVGGKWTPDLSNFQGKDEYWYDNYNATNLAGPIPLLGFLGAGISAATNSTLAPDQWSAKDHFNRYFRGEWLRGKENGTNTYLEDQYDDIRDKAFEDYMSKNYGKTDRKYTATNPVMNILQTIAPGLKVFSTPFRNIYRKNQINPNDPSERENWKYDSKTGTWNNFGNYASGKYSNGENLLNKNQYYDTKKGIWKNKPKTSNKQKLNSNSSTEPKNRKFKINPNFDISKLKKNGGIIKALNGIKIVRKTRDGRYEIISNDDKGYFFDPSTQLLTDNKGNQGLFTTYDLTQLFKVNPEFAKNLVDAGYSFTKSGAAGDHNTTDLVQAIYNSYVPKKNITESTNVNERQNVTAQRTPPAQVVPPVQFSQQGFTPEQFFDTLFGNQEYAKKFKQFLGIPDTSTEPETIGKQPEASTYESLVQANTTAFNNGMNSASWRRNFRKSFNNALLNGDMYGINPNGSQVFDINGMNVSEMIQNIGGLDPRKGLTRRGMRLLKKQQKAYNGNIFENVNTKVRTLPFQEISNQELDSLGQDALPQFQVHNHGLDVPFMNPTYEESDEGDIVNIGTKNIPFYQEVKRQ